VTMDFKPEQYSLADFVLGDVDSTDPTVPPADFTEWRRQTRWATQVFDAVLTQAPRPRTVLDTHSGRRPVVNLTSYGYLGMGTHPHVIEAAQAALREFGTGACSSPLMSGRTVLHRELELELATFLQRESVMLFNGGYGGALGSVAGLLRRGDVALLDSRSHVSLMDGARLAGAKLVTFEHNDASSLDRLLAAHAGSRRLVVTEGVFSMEGDLGALESIVPVAEAHGVPVLIDEAHSLLACGHTGRGVVEHSGMNGRVRLQYGTFSKAFSGVGGFIAGPAETIDYLRFYASSYGFSAALPAATIGALLAVLRINAEQPELRTRLWENATYFRAEVNKLGISTGLSTTYVVPLIVGSDRRLLYELSNELRDRGLFLAPVDYPSVPQDAVRFRASVTAAHTRADLDEALNILSDVMAPRVRQGTVLSG
jgi:7-keto-8-aminopelargonate synthetase-like enzyme